MAVSTMTNEEWFRSTVDTYRTGDYYTIGGTLKLLLSLHTYTHTWMYCTQENIGMEKMANLVNKTPFSNVLLAYYFLL